MEDRRKGHNITWFEGNWMQPALGFSVFRERQFKGQKIDLTASTKCDATRRSEMWHDDVMRYDMI